MKTSFLTVAVVTTVGLPLFTGCEERRVYVQSPPPVVVAPAAEVVVAQPPPTPPREVIVASPSPAYVWVPGYWSWQGRWVWVGGAWRPPPHPHARWNAGHWAHRGHGYVWVAGQWR